MTSERRSDLFRFKQFTLSNTRSAQRIGTDGVITGAASIIPAEPDALVWDLGAGTGLIALMIAQRAPEARIIAVELDPIAAGECRDNVQSSPWADRISVIQGDAAELADKLPRPSLIVSNPPFFTSGAVNPDPRRALARQDGSLNPLTLITLAARHLASGGLLSFIAPYDRNDAIQLHAELQRMTVTSTLDIASRSDRAPIRRLWSMMRRNEAPSGAPSNSRLDICNANPPGEYSREYRELTADFYLDF